MFYHATTPYANTAISQIFSVIDSGYKVNSVVQQGLITGGIAQASLNYSYLNENAPSDVTNPSYAPVAQLYLRHNFLQGFGKNVNNIYIRGARLGVTASYETFRSQLLNLVANVLNLYWDLVSDTDELKVRQRSLDAAQKTFEDTRHQIELGVVAKVEPPYPGYQRTMQALQAYVKFAKEYDGNQLPAIQKMIAPGDSYPGVPQLIRLLRLVGDLPADAGIPSDGTVYQAPLAWIIHDLTGEKRKDALKGVMNTGFWRTQHSLSEHPRDDILLYTTAVVFLLPTPPHSS